MGFVFFLVLIALQYSMAFFSLKERAYTAFTALLLFTTFTYDYLFITASYYIPEGLLLFFKPFNEYFLLYFLLRLLLQRKASREDLPVLLLLLVPCGLMLLHDLSRFQPGETFRGLRMYLVPLLLPYLMYRCGIFDQLRLRPLLRLLLLLVLLCGCYGWIQRISFTGEISQFWFYNYFNKFGVNPLHYGAANYIRNGQLRATGIFDSPITFSVMMSLTTAVITTLLIRSKDRFSLLQRRLLWLALPFLISCIWISQTRVGFILLAMALSLLVLERLRRRLPFWVLLLAPAALIAATLASLLVGVTKEQSALGRLDQYGEFAKHFSPLGLGFNSAYVLTYLDSYYLSLGLLFGLLAVFPLFWMGTVFYRLYKNYRARQEALLPLPLLIAGSGLFYAFAFQYMTGSVPFRLYFLLLFVCLAQNAAGHEKAADHGTV